MKSSNRSLFALCTTAFMLAGCAGVQTASVPPAPVAASVAHTTQRVSPDGIVYTPANVHIKNSTYNLDLNNDGTTDFVIEEINDYFGPSCMRQENLHGYLGLSGDGSNGFQVNNTYVAKLTGGSPIGPEESFTTGLGTMENVTLTFSPEGRGCSESYVAEGNWHPYAPVGYLGLAFVVGGKTYYGWAAITSGSPKLGWLSPTLTGYAYQTTAGKSINAGQR